MLLHSAFGALFVALLPTGLPLLGASPTTSVRCAAGALVAVLVAFAWVAERAFRNEALRGVLQPRAARVLRVPFLVVAAAELATVLDLAGTVGRGFVFLGLVALLGYAALAFVRLMFIRPADE